MYSSRHFLFWQSCISMQLMSFPPRKLLRFPTEYNHTEGLIMLFPSKCVMLQSRLVRSCSALRQCILFPVFLCHCTTCCCVFPCKKTPGLYSLILIAIPNHSPCCSYPFSFFFFKYTSYYSIVWYCTQKVLANSDTDAACGICTTHWHQWHGNIWPCGG